MGDDKQLRFRCIDTETTGIPSETEKHAMVELGWTDVLWRPGETPAAASAPMILDPRSILVQPGRPIPPEASAVHHIRDDDVIDGITPDEACAIASAAGHIEAVRPNYYVAHPVDFDRLFFNGGETPWLCTHKSSLRVLQDSPNHQVQTLRYVLGVDDDPLFDRELAHPPHRSAPDSYVLAHVFARLLTLATIDDMLRWSSGPALLVTCYLPKHKGKRWSQVAEEDRGYLLFIVDKSDLDRDHKATARYWLKKTERT